MPVIIEKSEHKLLEHLNHLENDRRMWHLAVLNGSQMTAANQRLLMMSEAHMTLMGIAWESGVCVYCCLDNDIVLLFQGHRETHWPTLRGVLQELLPHITPDNIDYSSLFTIFDLEHHYPQALAWAQQKHSYLEQGYCMLELVDSLPDEKWDHTRFETALQARSKRQKKLVGVIEDNRAQRQLAHSILRSEYDVLLASDGLEALELYNNAAPDLLFLDINLPHLDGIKVLRRIMGCDPQARIIMFSNQSSPHVLKTAIEIGAKGFVSKPFTTDALIKYAKKTLEMES
jgi:two-component system chemotaxis response regulator CheY